MKITDPRNNVGYFYFDALNHAVLHVDPEGYATQSSYDVFGNLAQTIRRATRVTGTFGIGQPPTIVADALHDQATVNEYDKLDRKLKVTDAEGYYEQYVYDARQQSQLPQPARQGDRVHLRPRGNLSGGVAGGRHHHVATNTTRGNRTQIRASAARAEPPATSSTS